MGKVKEVRDDDFKKNDWVEDKYLVSLDNPIWRLVRLRLHFWNTIFRKKECLK